MAAFWKKAVLCILVIELLGSASGFLTVSSIKGWYAELRSPPGTPPNWLFGPVWTVLYALMGYAVALVWHLEPEGREQEKARIQGLRFFWVQFVLNLAWTPCFFGLHRPGLALGVIGTLLGATLATILCFQRCLPRAGWVLFPYLCWICYATYLNAGFWWLNR